MTRTTFRTIVAAAFASALALPACLVEEVKVGHVDDGDGGTGGGVGQSGSGGGVGQGGAGGPAWACVDDGGPPQDPPVVMVRFTVLDPFSRLPVRDAKVRECAALDTECANAITDYTPVDADGVASLLMPTNQSAYFEIIEDGRVPVLAFFSRREVARGGGGRGVPLFTVDQMQAVLGDVGGFNPEGPASALLLGAALDCEGDLREGVSFSLEPAEARSADTAFFYTNENNLPQASLTQTSVTGSFGASNLNAGPALVSLAANGSTTKSAELKVHLRQGWLTQVFVSP